MNTNFKVIGLTRLAIKPKSTAREADVLTTRSYKLLKQLKTKLRSKICNLAFFLVQVIFIILLFVAYLSSYHEKVINALHELA